ncbi:hypothetical protein JW935_12095 [candidate division KSB1 bacterium]|nr:hypothetical protein [candidate division KSB1 bacterium]
MVNGIAENNRVLYQNVFTGMNLEYSTTYSGMKENFILSQAGRDGLPAPVQLGMSEETTLLAIENSIRFNENVEAFAEGHSITENDPEKGRKFEYHGNRGVLFRSLNGKGRFALPAGFTGD